MYYIPAGMWVAFEWFAPSVVIEIPLFTKEGSLRSWYSVLHAWHLRITTPRVETLFKCPPSDTYLVDLTFKADWQKFVEDEVTQWYPDLLNPFQFRPSHKSCEFHLKANYKGSWDREMEKGRVIMGLNNVARLVLDEKSVGVSIPGVLKAWWGRIFMWGRGHFGQSKAQVTRVRTEAVVPGRVVRPRHAPVPEEFVEPQGDEEPVVPGVPPVRGGGSPSARRARGGRARGRGGRGARGGRGRRRARYACNTLLQS